MHEAESFGLCSEASFCLLCSVVFSSLNPKSNHERQSIAHKKSRNSCFFSAATLIPVLHSPHSLEKRSAAVPEENVLLPTCAEQKAPDTVTINSTHYYL